MIKFSVAVNPKQSKVELEEIEGMNGIAMVDKEIIMLNAKGSIRHLFDKNGRSMFDIDNIKNISLTIEINND